MWAAAYAMTPPDVAASMNYAKAMASATVIPRHYRRQPGNVFWAVSFAQMTGMHPLAVMDQIWFNAEGKPAAHYTLIATLVRRAGHTLRVTGDMTSATCTITRADDPENPYPVTWDLDRAKRAELIQHIQPDGTVIATDTDGRPTHWQLYTESLLVARAVTAAARLACPEALYGLCYTPEELGARVDGEGKVTGIAPARQEQRPQTDDVERWLKVFAGTKTPQALEAAGKSLATAKEGGKVSIDEAGNKRLNDAYRERMHALGGGQPRPELPVGSAPAEQPQQQAAPVDAGNEYGDMGLASDDMGEQAAADVQEPGDATDEATDEPTDGGWGSGWGEPTDGDPFAGLSDEDPMGGEPESENGELFMTRAANANPAAAALPHP
jgi:hypothetical protein